MHKKKEFWAVFALVSLLLCLTACGDTTPTETTVSQQTTAETSAETTVETTAETTVLREFGYDGDYLTCLTAESLLGIDVSSFQKEIDWEKVKSAGIEFVMIRVGFRGYGETGVLCEDKFAQKNYKGAKEAGLKIGGYFFSQATTEEEAVEEANYVLELTETWEMDMPFGFDWECHTDQYRTAKVGPKTLTDCTKAFCQTLADQGKSVLIYSSPDQSPKELFWEEVSQYGLWLGEYDGELEDPNSVTMWQYTNQGKVPGIKGNADINLFFPE